MINKQNLPDFSISRSTKSVPWGIDLPWDKDQKSYVWVDALSNYITALDYPEGDLFKKFWPADIQLMALDILKFHALYWPAILLALGVELPKQLAIHGFFTINGQKMSKSIGNVIHPDEIVEKYGAESSKYLILSQFSFGSESDINVEGFKEKYNADLVNGLGNLINRTTKMVEDYLEGKVTIDFQEQDIISERVENLDFKGALNEIWKLIRESNSLIDEKKPWALVKEEKTKEIKEILEKCLENIYVISVSLKAFMPNKSQEILDIITADQIKKPDEPLFPRLS